MIIDEREKRSEPRERQGLRRRPRQASLRSGTRGKWASTSKTQLNQHDAAVDDRSRKKERTARMPTSWEISVCSSTSIL